MDMESLLENARRLSFARTKKSYPIIIAIYMMF